MKKILIIAPHYPPSNLAGVHRARLFAQHLPALGWLPILLTVNEKFYEEALDKNLEQLLPAGQRIEKVDAFKVYQPRMIGDIGLRAFFQLRKKALEIVQTENIDFVYIPIPSFYASLIGPYLHHKKGVKYGIDYIDPWVHHFAGADKKLSRHWWSGKLAKWLEPKAVGRASLITGVAAGYYDGVIQRHPELLHTCLFGAMPYGGEVADHERLSDLALQPYLFKKNKKFQMVYAGAMLPLAHAPLEAIFKSIAAHVDNYKDVEFHFIGTSRAPNDAQGFTIKPLAQKYHLWQSVVFEYPKRIPYLDVLTHLSITDAVFILGSTEPHYTPSKTYQAVLSKKPIMAVLHSESSAVAVIQNTHAGEVLAFDGAAGLEMICNRFDAFFTHFQKFCQSYRCENVDQSVFEQYSAKAVTSQLAVLLDAVHLNALQ